MTILAILILAGFAAFIFGCLGVVGTMDASPEWLAMVFVGMMIAGAGS